MKLFRSSKDRQEQVEREAREEFEQRISQAQPPTEAERTWVIRDDQR